MPETCATGPRCGAAGHTAPTQRRPTQSEVRGERQMERGACGVRRLAGAVGRQRGAVGGTQDACTTVPGTQDACTTAHARARAAPRTRGAPTHTPPGTPPGPREVPVRREPRGGAYTTTGHLKVEVSFTRRPVACDWRAAVMISSTCRACSGVTRSSRPVARLSAASAAPTCQR